ncbi:fibronectin type III domain-containing protein [Streptosporangium canum]|uniref:DUF7927 domain-containing protein n=1 Tax=Streptosporangium canum TaxID=324952 RepID=UPI003414270E
MSGRPGDRAGTRPGRRGRDVVGAVAWAPRHRRRVARIMALALTGSALTGPPSVPASAAAAGTVLFNQPFHNSAANGTGAVVLPALPSGTGTTNFACLTASGNTSTGVLRSCTTSTDSAGSGKLRLTNATTSKAGGVFSATSVPTSQGLDVAFNTYQYGGGGADGITFVLAAVDPANPQSPANIGQLGGALGYSASGGSSGLAYGYLGIGFDVYGNFSNSTYQGSGCTNPAYIGTGSVRVPGQVLVRGPGNGAVGYCALNSTATSTGSSALALRATARTAVPVQIGINPTSSVLTTAAGLAIPANSYRMVVTLVGGTTRTLTGTLPSVTSGLYPASWLNASGIPRQLAFGWVASTGAVTDFHEIDEATVSTISAVPELTVAQTGYSASTLSPGDPVTYGVVAGVAAGLPETSPVSITQTLPAGTVPVGAYGTGWVCDAPSGRSITCTNGNGPFAAGAALPALTVVGVVTGGNVTPALVQSTTVATASSIDASPAYSSSATAGTLPATPGGITVSPALGSIAGGTTVTVSGTNIANATAIEIGTTAQQEAGTPVVLLPCATGVTTGCFTINANGTLTIPSMPARAANGAVNINVVTQGLDVAATYTYVASPGAPTAPTAVAGVTSATVSWTAPASNSGTITGYIVTPYRNGVAQTPVTFNASATSRTLTGLTADVPYTFTVAAVNAIGTGSASPASNPVVPYNVPGRPVITAATAGTSAATLTWTAPSSNGSAVTGYVVTPYINGVAQPTQTFTSTATTQTVTGLTPGTAYTFTVTAVNAAGPGQPSEPSTTATPNSPPAFTFPAPPAGEVGVAYSVPLTVSGGTAPYTWSVSAGSLPPGLILNASTGVLSGTPTAAGGYSFTVKVLDAQSQSDTTTVSLTVVPQPAFTFPAPPAAQVGVAYSVPLTVSGGTVPYTWSVSAGSLPPGLTLNASTGVLSGTSTTTGGYPVTFRAVDANGQATTRAVTLVVTSGPLVVVKTASASSAVTGGTVGYTITVDNTGPSAFTGVMVNDALAGILDDAAYNGDATATAGSVSFAGQTLTWTGNVAAGTGVTITYSITVNNPDTGNKVLANAVTSPTVGSTCPAGGGDPRCSATVTVTGLSIVKTADVTTTTPGGTVRFTITATNNGQTPYTGATFGDALAGVLDDAVYNGDATATSGSLSIGGSTLTWTGNLAVGASTTVTYTVTVRNPDPGDRSLAGTVLSGTPGNTCPQGNPGPQCTAVVTVLVPALAITSSADVTATTPGSVVRYTFTASNTGQTPYTGTSFTTSLLGALDDATFDGDLAATSGSAVLNPDGTVTWTGDLAVGAAVMVTGSVTVRSPDTGDRVLRTSVTSAAPGSTCPVGNQAPACLTGVPVLVPGLTITKTADVSTTTPGSVVRYTIAVTNSGQTPYTAATVADALAGVLDDATYNADAAATSGSVGSAGSTLTWVGDLDVGASATITYSVTVRDPDPGDRTLTGTVSSPATGGNCPAGSGDPRCAGSVTVLVPQLTITTTTGGATTTPGAVVPYTVTLANTGQTPYPGAAARFVIADVLDDAVYNGDLTTDSGSLSVAPDGAILWTGDIAAGATVTITGSVTVHAPVSGDRVLRTSVTSAAPGSTCPVIGATAPGCFTVVTVLVPALTITNTADTQTATPGDRVTYTITVANTGETPYTGAQVTESLTRVLSDAVYDGDAVATAGTVAFAGSDLSWSGDLAVGASATITYSVTVRDPDPGDAQLTSTAVSPARGSNCQAGSADPRCTVSVPVARLVLEQGYTQTGATPGSVVRLNATFTNTGQVPYTGIRVFSASGDTVDDAIPNGDQVADSGTLVLDAQGITWTGNIPVGGVVNVTGTLTLKNPPTGNRTLTGTLVSGAPGNTCPPGGSDPRCTSRLDVLVPGLTITKAADTVATVQGGAVGYTVTVTNSGQTPYTGAAFTDALAGVLDDAVYNGDAAATAGTVAFAGSDLSWSGDLAVGASATITYSVTVRGPDPGDRSLTGTISSPTTGTNCAPASGDPRCTSSVIVLIPALTITKSVSPTTAVPGSTITYTITAANTGQLPYTGAAFTDALAGVLDDAVYNGDAAATAGTVAFAGSGLSWSGDLAVGASATITYSVTVDNPVTGDRNLASTITSATPGTTCPAGGTDPRCGTGVPVTQATTLTFHKSADTRSVAQGGVVTYTITISNSGLIPYAGAAFTDPLAGVLDDAAHNGDATAGTGLVTVAGSLLSWTGNVPANGSTTVTYSVTADTQGAGDDILTGTLVSPSPGGNCEAGGGDPRCTATVTVARLSIVTTANAPTVKPGDAVRYTTVMTNTGQTPYNGISVLFNGYDGLDDAVPGGDQVATSGSLSLGLDGLTWTGSIPVGGSVTLTGSVTVNNPDLGDRVIPLTVVSAAQGTSCPVATAPGCTVIVNVLIPELTITKVADRNAAVPGGAVAYTITVANTGQTPYTGATATDSLAGLLDDAVYNGDATATTGTIGLAGQTLTWSGDLAVGAAATVTYSATANSPDVGDKLLTNSVVSTEAGSTCPPASANAACSARVVVLTPALTIVKTADRASATPGGTVAYTVHVTNTGQVPFAAADFTDALAGVLDDAVYNGDATATTGTVTFAGQDLNWTGGLSPGQAATVAYSVTAAAPGAGDQRLTSAVTSTTAGTTCPAGGTDTRCSDTVLISRITITASADAATAIPTGTVRYTVTIANTGQTPYSDAVVDGLLADIFDDAAYNGDGTASAGNLTFVPGSGQASWEGRLAAGDTVTVTFSVTVRNPDPGDRVMNAVMTSDTPGNNCPAGSADPACASAVTVLTPVLAVSKSADRTTVTPGGTIAYTITVANTGQTPYTGATVTDRLTRVLPDAVYNGDAAATAGAVAFAGSDVTWSGDLAVGASATITYTVTVRDPDPGDKRIVNRAFSDTLGSTCPSTGSVPACTTLVTVLVPALRVVKVADTVVATPGETVGYTVTVTNSGQTPYTGATVTDALAGVLDDAAYDGDAVATSGTVAFAGADLIWTGDLAVGESATVDYSVTVDIPDTGDRLLTGAATSNAPGSTCPAGTTDPACVATVTVLIPGLAVSTVADRATTTPGGAVRYTVTIANTGQTAYSGISVSDVLTEVLDDAAYNGEATATAGTVVFSSPVLTWTGDLAIGETATVTYTVTVAGPGTGTGTGDRLMTGTVASSAPGSTCPVGSTAPACVATVTVLLPALDIVKTAGAPTTVPGGTVGYTITVTNSGQTPYTGATVTDSLHGLLDAAAYNGDAVATTGVLAYAEPVLTWTGDLAVGASATITYSITANGAATGDKALTNVVTSDAPGSTCPAEGSAPACSTLVRLLVPELTIVKSADRATVVAGDTVRYTITATNTGETGYPGATFADSLAGVLDDAVHNGDAVATTGVLAYAEPVLTWTGDLAIGATVTITYSVAVAYPVPGDRLLSGTVVSALPGSTCPAGGADPRCTATVTVLVPALGITKTADTSGEVVAGGTVRYTIVVTNTGEAPYDAAAFTDSLAGVLDDAVYNGDAVATTGVLAYTEPALTWTGALPVDAGAVVTFSVTVADPATGNAELDNQVTSVTTGSTCRAGGTDPRCSVVTSVAATSMTLTGVTEDFTLTGPANTTVRGEDVVTMTVVTNSVDGYTVTARATATELVPVQPGVTAGIPVANLRVREHGTSTFRSLSTTDPVLVYDKPLPSAPGGDGISNDYEVDIPFVPTGRYTMTIDYIATAK